MKTQLLLVVISVTLVDSVVFSIVSGCGIFQAIPLGLAWYLVRLCSSPFFASYHEHLLAAVGALLSACFLAALLAFGTMVARKRGRLVSQSSLTKRFAIWTAVYLVLSLLPFPVAPLC